MKTLIIWEEGDIEVGRWVYRSDDLPAEPDNYSFFCTTAYMICYDHGIEGKDYYRLVSLADGMITKPKNKADLVETLTKNNHVPLPADLLVKLIRHKHG